MTKLKKKFVIGLGIVSIMLMTSCPSQMTRIHKPSRPQFYRLDTSLEGDCLCEGYDCVCMEEAELVGTNLERLLENIIMAREYIQLLEEAPCYKAADSGD